MDARPRPRADLVDDDPSARPLSGGGKAPDRARPFGLRVVGDGASVLDLLRSGGPETDLGLLGPDMQGMDARATLAGLERDPVLRSVPVIVLTPSTSTSTATRDREEALGPGANAFLSEPPSFRGLKEMMRAVATLWLRPARS